jgi:undecaprenyl-diphosphatase
MSETFAVTTSLIINTYTPPWAYTVLCLIIAAVLLYFRKTYEAVIFLTGFIATSGLVFILKHTFTVPRPSNALIEFNGYAFPSSHAALAIFLAVNLIWILFRKNKLSPKARPAVAVTLLSLALLVGFSRIVIHAHTPFQVLVGFMVGAVVPLSVIYLAKKFKRLVF